MCFASTLPIVDKFAPRAIKVVFMGYSSVTKEYILFDLVKQKLFINRDVGFHESQFPFKSSSVFRIVLFQMPLVTLIILLMISPFLISLTQSLSTIHPPQIPFPLILIPYPLILLLSNIKVHHLFLLKSYLKEDPLEYPNNLSGCQIL